MKKSIYSWSISKIKSQMYFNPQVEKIYQTEHWLIGKFVLSKQFQIIEI